MRRLVERTVKALNSARNCSLAAKTAIVLCGLADSAQDESWLAALVYPKSDARTARHLARRLRAFNPTHLQDDASLRRFLNSVGREHVDTFLCAAWAWQPTGEVHDTYRRAKAIAARGDALTLHELAVDGRDVQQAWPGASGPEIGQALQRLLEHVWHYPADNDRERLLALLAQWRNTPR